MIDITQMGKRARAAGRQLATYTTAQKNAALQAIATRLLADSATILEANARDMEAGRAAGISPSLLDRMLLTEARLQAIAADTSNVASLPDPVGKTLEERTLPNGLHLEKRRVPFGVIGVIYEARPNVTVDVAALCLKSGNAVLMRGGKEIVHSCAALTASIQAALADAGLPANAVQVIESSDRELVKDMLRLDRYIDVIIPRGGAALHRFCVENATIPVIVGGIGVCHVYVDQAADPNYVVPIVHNGKVQRPSVCNALDTMLVHHAVAEAVLPDVARDLLASKVELRCDERSFAVLQQADIADDRLQPAQADDFGTEFMALKLSIRVVDSLDDAIEHIATYGSGHSEAILTEDDTAAQRFVNEVDAAAVFVNASTRFNDGAQMGMGAEIAISTQKLHARGPMALEELTTYKWVVRGNGQIRG